MQRDDNLTRQIGSRIRQRREEKGITQVDLAVVCQVTREQIQRIENGNKRPSFEVLGAICQELNITADYIIQDGQRTNQEYLLSEYARYFMQLDTRDK
ncbi:MAG: helix-turn-helix transcriptional regulator, partial [Eubacteriales bacterium]|nr:helix-turn-helix transcriptional regulator [Eubacteriales bacterium]